MATPGAAEAESRYRFSCSLENGTSAVGGFSFVDLRVAAGTSASLVSFLASFVSFLGSFVSFLPASFFTGIFDAPAPGFGFSVAAFPGGFF